MILALCVALGAALGSPLRFACERYFVRVAGESFPWGTLLVNVVGSALFGAVVGAARGGGLSIEVITFACTGFCGALTTFSGFSAQVLELGGGRARGTAVAYASASVVAGVGVAAVAYALAA